MRRLVHPRAAALGGLGIVVVVLAVFLLTSRDSTYTMRLQVADAAGLRDGSPVSVGGVRIGKVKLALGGDDQVRVALEVQKGKRIPRDARVSISAVNFLGQKQVLFTGGDPASPAPAGYTFPGDRVEVSTDLDQVLGTLDTDTRSKLAVLINEAGAGVAGRKLDISTSLQEVPNDLAEAHEVLSRLVSDNRTLGDVVQRTDAFIDATTRKREQLAKLIDTFGETSETVETKRAELAASLRQAPGTLRTLQGFLGKLQQTTVPLGPAAREISATAPLVTDTLSKVEGFRKAADPALDRATDVAPTLSKLADEATPVLRKAEPTTRSLAQLVPAAQPVSDGLFGSADNLIATIENWSQAIQLRDGLSHIFRGEAAYSPDAVAAALDRLDRPADKPAATRKARKPAATKDAAPSTPAATPQSGSDKPQGGVVKLPGGLDKPVRDVAGQATKAVDGVLGQVLPQGDKQPAPSAQSATDDLLDFLLGS